MKLWILFLLLTFVLTCTVLGQSGGSSQVDAPKVVLTGTVYDLNGSVIVDAQLLARSLEAKDYQATTNDEGIYKIELPPDVYRIEVNAPGFCPKRVEQFRVVNLSRNQRSLDFVLSVSEGDRPCKQKTMIKKKPQTRQPELFRSIAE